MSRTATSFDRTAATLGIAVASAFLLSVMSILSPMTARAADVSVPIEDFVFTPETLTVAVGDTVTWTNADAAPHTATAEDGAFDSGNLDTGESYSFTFTEPGTYAYRCDYHSEMQGTIVVEAAAAPGSTAPEPSSVIATPVPSTASASPTPSAEDVAAEQPDTALPAGSDSSPMPIAVLLIGLGLVAVAFGLIPIGMRAVPAVASTHHRRSGWRR